MSADGFEWPAPDAPKCGAYAEDRNTGEVFQCMLKRNHRSLEHHWEKITGDTLRAVSWIQMGSITYVG